MFRCAWLGLCIPCPHRWSFGTPWQPLPPHAPSHLLALTDPSEEWLSSRGRAGQKDAAALLAVKQGRLCAVHSKEANNEGLLQSRSFYPESTLVIHHIAAWMELQGIFWGGV